MKQITLSLSAIILLILLPALVYGFPREKSAGRNFVFGDKVYLREEPSLKGRIIATLKIGTEVDVITKSDAVLTQDTVKENWYKVICGQNEGYIWGYLLANKYLEEDFDSDGVKEILLVRNISEGSYSEIHSNYDPKIKQLEMRMVKNNKVLDDNFDMGDFSGECYVYPITFKTYNGFNEKLKLVKMQFSCQGESGIEGDIYYSVTQKNIKSVLKVYSASHDGSYVSFSIFPHHKNGLFNKVILLKNCQSFYNDSNPAVDFYIIKSIYEWSEKAGNFILISENEILRKTLSVDFLNITYRNLYIYIDYFLRKSVEKQWINNTAFITLQSAAEGRDFQLFMKVYKKLEQGLHPEFRKGIEQAGWLMQGVPEIENIPNDDQTDFYCSGRKFFRPVPYKIMLSTSPIEYTKNGTLQCFEKKNKVRYDSQRGLYVFTLWKNDETPVEVFHEVGNKIKLKVVCSVAYDANKGEYVYTYEVYNDKSSKQKLRQIILNTDINFVLTEEKPKPYESFIELAKKCDICRKWIAWSAVHGEGISVNDSGIFKLKSKYGPIIADSYAEGDYDDYVHPMKSENMQFYRRQPGEEGVAGKTISPGILDVTKNSVYPYLVNILKTSLEWGWINKLSYDVLYPIAHVERNYELFMSKYRELVYGVEPEFKALVEHVERKMREMK